ncbi:MAG: hypothetical protein NTV05_17460 [Acidobacteria bacterium]|nr:hypothetical protein [Acidobacteriota bacterium]
MRYVILAVVVFFVGREFERRIGSKLRSRWGSEWGEPPFDPYREKAGLVLVIVGVAAAALLMAACPFPGGGW